MLSRAPSGALEESTRLGVPVMAHAHSTEGIRQAVVAGVRSIEHGTFLDDEGLRLMKERGTYLVPTLTIGEFYLRRYETSQAQRKMIELTRRYRQENFSRVAAAIGAGLKVCVGSDLGGYDEVEANVEEFELLRRLGMSPMEAIWAGTRVNAELLGLDQEIGTLEAGKRADLIAVRGNPLEDLGLLRQMQLVMRDGRVVSAS